jgi:hypothetical protein
MYINYCIKISFDDFKSSTEIKIMESLEKTKQIDQLLAQNENLKESLKLILELLAKNKSRVDELLLSTKDNPLSVDMLNQILHSTTVQPVLSDNTLFYFQVVLGILLLILSLYGISGLYSMIVKSDFPGFLNNPDQNQDSFWSWFNLLFDPTFKKKFELFEGDTLSFTDGCGHLYEIVYRNADSYRILVKVAGETEFTSIQGLLDRIYLAELCKPSAIQEIVTPEGIQNVADIGNILKDFI